jgi:hypothetical protein
MGTVSVLIHIAVLVNQIADVQHIRLLCQSALGTDPILLMQSNRIPPLYYDIMKLWRNYSCSRVSSEGDLSATL